MMSRPVAPALRQSLWAILALWMVLLCGVGCQEESKADDDGEREAAISEMSVVDLEALRARLKRDRRWD